MSQPPTIFVQIASYRDPELLPTLQSLFAQAARPQRISVGICQQYGAGEAVKPQPQGVKPQQLRWHVVPYEESRGVHASAAAAA